jgi:methylase of polypeptide subunit release factors
MTPAEKGAALAARRIARGALVAPHLTLAIPSDRREAAREAASRAQELRSALKAGVTHTSAPQLFPTPPALARRMVEAAGVAPGHRVLEPSAGTGRLLVALPPGCDVVAVEIAPALAARTTPRARCADFLSLTPDVLGRRFDRIVMNPPFRNGQDVRHILHARQFLAPGGALVALCANGPRQRAALQPLATEWHDLPPGAFASEGTDVHVAMLVLES